MVYDFHLQRFGFGLGFKCAEASCPFYDFSMYVGLGTYYRDTEYQPWKRHILSYLGMYRCRVSITMICTNATWISFFGSSSCVYSPDHGHISDLIQA